MPALDQSRRPAPPQFSTVVNLSFWAAGVGLYVLPFLSFERLPAQAFGAGMLLVLLGGCSGAFHADGSRPQTWRHATDRIMMYALVSYLGVISIGGLWQAWRGHSASLPLGKKWEVLCLDDSELAQFSRLQQDHIVATR